ncbi:MAG: hypothetical protein ACHQ53_05315 [Polyangiales bacterium]
MADFQFFGFRARAACIGLVVGCVVSACAGNPAAFGPKYPDNRDSQVELLLQRLNAAAARAPGTIAAGIAMPGQAPTGQRAGLAKLYAFDLTTHRVLWQQPIDATSAPYLAGEVVLVQTRDAIAGFELRSGARRFSIDRGDLSIKGADGEGPVVCLTMGKGQGTFAKSEAVALRGSSLLWRRSVDSMTGVPAVTGNLVLVPWASQFLSAIDLESGTEIARVRVQDGVIAHAWNDGGQVYIGSYHGITRVTSSVGSGTLRGAGYFALPDHELPGRPLLLSDVYTTLTAPAPDSAQHRIGLAFRIKPVDRVRIGLADDNLYLFFYRFVFALNPSDYSVRWVYAHDADVVGVGAEPGGIVFADERGRFAFLSAASGDPVWRQDTALPSAVVRMPLGSGEPSAAGQPLDPSVLAVRLMTAAQDTDARLVPARMLAVKELARLSQAEATEDLIELCDSDKLSPAVRENACVELKHRSIGVEHLLKALERHAAYLEGTTSPPVGALAKAAASLKEKRAVGPLLGHLKDPNTRASDLLPLVKSLGELGDPAATEPLEDFLRLYHADPLDEHVLRALEATPEVLVKLSGPVVQPVLEAVTYDELGAYTVRQKARAALDGLAAQQAAAEKKEEAGQQAQEQVAAQETEAADPSKYAPTSLTLELIDATLLPVRDQLLACLNAGPNKAFQARVLLAVEDGKVLMVSVLQKDLQACIEPLIRSQPFPKTKSAKREQLTYVIKR